MTRDRIIVFGILAVVVVLAVSRRVLTSTTLLFVGVAIPSIILHEVAHGVAALFFGDDTAKKAGRLTLNPIPHIDVFGTLIIPALLALSGHAIFGYAKPVPINPNKMRQPLNDAVWVSLAGPATNLLLAALAGLWIRLHPALLQNVAAWSFQIPYYFGSINVILAVFNLIPIPPLDGSSVVTRFLPKSWESWWIPLSRYGMFILIGILLLAPTALSWVLNPVLNEWGRLIS